MTADAALLAALADCAAALRRLGRPAMIIGGLAVITRGLPRQTVDIDATIWAEGLGVETILPALAAHGFIPHGRCGLVRAGASRAAFASRTDGHAARIDPG